MIGVEGTPARGASAAGRAGGGSDGHTGLLVEGAEQIATLRGGLHRGPAQGDLGVIARGAEAVAVACFDGRILAAGTAGEVHRAIDSAGLSLDRFRRLDASGCVVTPGLIDSHTHLLFAGSREAEWQLRARGAGYLEILAAGGGILSTVATTRAASDEELLGHGRRWLGEMLRHGTTTVEAKSGYGLSVEQEVRLVSLAGMLEQEGPVDVVPTWLGAHAVPLEFRDREDGHAAYVAQLLDRQLPAIARQNVARFADVFCERDVFTVEETRRIAMAAAQAGLGVRLHADEVEESGGAELAAELAATAGCLAVDHLDAISPAGIEALATTTRSAHPVVATLLPAASWFLMRGRYPPARALVDAGVPVALATDFNPGTAPVASLALVMSIACLELRLTPAEALVAVTVNAAHALGMADRIGSLEAGKQADLVVWSVPRLEQIPYWAGADLAGIVVKRGRVVRESEDRGPGLLA